MLTINFYGSWLPLILSQDLDQSVEDVVVAAAQVLEISPLCRHLFGLRNTTSTLWVALSKKISILPQNSTLQFRLRFRAHSLSQLKALDPNAFEYLFHQVRIFICSFPSEHFAFFQSQVFSDDLTFLY